MATSVLRMAIAIIAGFAVGIAGETMANGTCDGRLLAAVDVNRLNKTALNSINAPSWVPNPELRGTMAILQTCILTLIACIYTAVHLDVPWETNFAKSLLRKAKWALVALFAPETVLYFASAQLLEAWKLRKKLKELQQESSDETVRDFKFDLRYAFLIAMGGLELDYAGFKKLVTYEDMDPIQKVKFVGSENGKLKKVRLTPSGVIQLAKGGQWIDIKARIIDDKSKANVFQKVLVLLQVSWMATTCITRKVYGLPMTLLEIHTLVHVFCALLLYAFWFKKPLDVQLPEARYESSWDPTVAAILQDALYQNESYFYLHVGQKTETETRQFSKINLVFDDDDNINTPSYQMETLGDNGKRRFKEVVKYLDANLQVFNSDDRLGPSPNLRSLLRCSIYARRRDLIQPRPEWGIRPKNLSRYEPLMGFATSALYGGIHLAVWNFPLPTRTELLLWRISGLCIVATLPCLALLEPVFLLKMMMGWNRRRREVLDEATRIERNRRWPRYILWFRNAYYGVVITISTLARIFIVVEAFISLRRVPVGVYWMPAWLQMIPHV